MHIHSTTAGTTTSARGRGLHRELVGMLFALTSVQVAIEGAAILNSGISFHQARPTYFHLALAASIIATSWVGRRESRESDSHVESAFGFDFVELLLDLWLVMACFFLVRGAELPIDSGTGGTIVQASMSSEVLWVAAIFPAYFLWDLWDKNWRRDDNGRLKMIQRGWASAVCAVLALTIYVYFPRGSHDTTTVLLADGVLLCLVFLFLAMKRGNFRHLRPADWSLILGLAGLGAVLTFKMLTAPGASAGAPAQVDSRATYLDAHNHSISGILPYYAYADLRAFIRDPEDPAKVDLEHRRELWKYLAAAPSSVRMVKGAIATAQAYDPQKHDLSPQQINGALKRVLTTTPWSEFDSAYAYRGDPVESYLRVYFAHDVQKMKETLCEAALLQLAVTRTAYSEQFVNFTGGWKASTVAGRQTSSKLDAIRCFMGSSRPSSASAQFNKWPTPEVKVLLMTHTSELGDVVIHKGTDTEHRWKQYASKPGTCEELSVNGKFDPPLMTKPDEVRNDLIGLYATGAPDVASEELPAYFDHVVGVDTAGTEITCFTDDGMANYEALVDAVYQAARDRRRNGWHGKLLVHTHVGEGGVSYSGPLTADDFFKALPLVATKAGQPVHAAMANQNIKVLLTAVERIKEKYRKDGTNVDDYLIFRFGHVTNADIKDAHAMAALHIEADINLESNISTRAYYTTELATAGPGPLTEARQFEYNDLPAQVLRSGRASEILSNHALKYMLEAGVRTLLGSDGGGEEHSDIGREYKWAGDLITYWKSHEAGFPATLSGEVFQRNAREHLDDMRDDKSHR